MPRVKSLGNIEYEWRENNDDAGLAMLLIRRNIPLLFVGGRAIRCMKEVKRENHILRKLLAHVGYGEEAKR